MGAKSLNKVAYDFYEKGLTEGLPTTGGLTNAQLTAVTGTAGVAAWSGTGNGTEIAILKAIYAQNAQMIALLTAIRDNTASG